LQLAFEIFSLGGEVHTIRRCAKELAMSEASESETPLKATFRIKLNAETLSISTVGHAYRFVSSLSTAAAENAMMSVQATNALRALL